MKQKHALVSVVQPDADETALRNAIVAKLTYVLGKQIEVATPHDWYCATALAVRDRIVDVWQATRRETKRQQKKRVYYLSIEFLIGRLLLDTLTNLRLVDPVKHALASLGVDFEQIITIEPDAALGNGGLGRLAACFMDSMSALKIPAYGYGIRYEHGLFEQRIHNGWQQEVAEEWLARGNPWEFKRAESTVTIGFGGTVEYIGGDDKKPRAPSGIRPNKSSRSLTTRRLPAGAGGTSMRYGYGPRTPRIRSSWPLSIRATSKAPGAARARRPRRSRACCIPTTRRRPDRNSACDRSSSLRPRRCRTWSTPALSPRSRRSDEPCRPDRHSAQRYAPGHRRRWS